MQSGAILGDGRARTSKDIRLNRKNLILVAALAIAGATGLAVAQTSGPDTSQDTAWHNRQSLALAERGSAKGWQSVGGVRWRRIKGDGSGKHPAVSDTVTLHYAGTLVDGTEFDSSWTRGEPATFPLGRLIPAWQMAVPMMGVGDTIEIAAPSDLAYGPRGKRPIPGGATLLFKIELLGIEGK